VLLLVNSTSMMLVEQASLSPQTIHVPAAQPSAPHKQGRMQQEPMHRAKD